MLVKAPVPQVEARERLFRSAGEITHSVILTRLLNVMHLRFLAFHDKRSSRHDRMSAVGLSATRQQPIALCLAGVRSFAQLAPNSRLWM
ncbi:hypothetical protein I0C86_36495 [Plantactinospora sp. S1510]|uniref:Uncharacterized protein n=1 Tax=Plantactinospora alkalitolerans TaxID=2789879 RepID=A0ABS0H7F2_9ACTN|nr:hypothetical protein [Plantactinospora alkalitolerans]MBF9134389.1 hypothetical protein [Plantactinospora alkalitolerans]